jgi:hypothetical protein
MKLVEQLSQDDLAALLHHIHQGDVHYFTLLHRILWEHATTWHTLQSRQRQQLP